MLKTRNVLFYLMIIVCATQVSARPQELEYTERQIINVWLASPELTPTLKTLAQQFSAKHPAVQINAVNLPNEDLKTSLVKAVYNNNAPEIAIFSSDNTVYAKHMRLSAFDSLSSVSLDDTTLDALRFNDKYYGQPIQDKNRLVLMYNKSLVGNPATTWEGIIEQTPYLLQQGILPVGVLFNEPYWFAHFVTLFDPQITNTEQPILSTPAMQQALTLYRSLADMKSIDKDCNYDCVSIEFYAGKVAYTMGGVWALEQASEALGKNLGIIDLPSYQGRPMHALTSMVFLVYPNDSWNGTKQTAIRAFSAFLQSDDAQQQLARATSMVPLRPDVLTDLSVVPLLVAQEKLTAPVLYMPANNAYVSIWNGMRKGLRLHQRGALSTQEAVDFMQRIALRDMAMMEVAQ